MNRASSSLVSTRKIVFAGLLIAMGIVLKMFEISVTPNFRIGFTTVPTIFSGILLGPIYGFAIGFLSDFIQFVIKSDGGAFHLGFTLTSALYGLIPGLIAMMVKRKNIELSLKHVVDNFKYRIPDSDVRLRYDSYDTTKVDKSRSHDFSKQCNNLFSI